MEIRVLGSAAGGGLPQWNCHCPYCTAARAGDGDIAPRTQSSLAVGDGTGGRVLINASPDLRQQVNAFGARDADAVRSMPFQAVILVDSQIDHTAGLLLLRDGHRPLPVWCTPAVREDLTGAFPVFTLLERYCGIEWHPVPARGEPFRLPGLDRLEFSAVPVPGKAPPYAPSRGQAREGENIGIAIRDRHTGGRAFYAPGLAAFSPAVDARMAEANCLLVDGTAWRDEDLLRCGAGRKTAREMGHLPLDGPGGMLEWLARHRRTRRVLVHVNNTNPILDPHGPARAALTRDGIEVAYDGMELSL